MLADPDRIEAEPVRFRGKFNAFAVCLVPGLAEALVHLEAERQAELRRRHGQPPS
jgi:hypothetical protein